MDDVVQDPGWLALLDEMRAAAVQAYGEERAAEALLRTAQELAATAAWLVMGERLDPLDTGPECERG